MEDRQIINAIAANEPGALARLYALYQAKVYNSCLAYLQNIEDAQEAVQDVFVEVHQSAHAFRGDASVSTWIYRLTVNKCIDRLRHAKRQKRFALMSRLFNTETGRQEFDKPDFNHPGILLENKEKAGILFKAMQQLPESQRSAFILKNIEGLTQKEIAAIMGIGEKAVESLLQRAKVNLRKYLSAYYNDSEGKI